MFIFSFEVMMLNMPNLNNNISGHISVRVVMLKNCTIETTIYGNRNKLKAPLFKFTN